VVRVTSLVGLASDADVGERLHALSHAGQVEYVILNRADMSRHRLRVVTDRGTECAIALPRSEKLANGAVLLLEAERAIVVRMQEEDWLDVAAVDDAAALELGYLAGNMHWRVRFDGTVLKIALDGPEASYLARLAPLLDSGRVRRTGS
jgi:urease accessory protein